MSKQDKDRSRCCNAAIEWRPGRGDFIGDDKAVTHTSYCTECKEGCAVKYDHEKTRGKMKGVADQERDVDIDEVNHEEMFDVGGGLGSLSDEGCECREGTKDKQDDIAERLQELSSIIITSNKKLVAKKAAKLIQDLADKLHE